MANFIVQSYHFMNIGENIKRIRTAKNLSQKEVVTAAKLDTAQYSRIETGKTDPSVSTLDRIAKALGVSLAELFASADELKEINSLDKSVMEKVSLIESLSEEEKKPFTQCWMLSWASANLKMHSPMCCRTWDSPAVDNFFLLPISHICDLFAHNTNAAHGAAFVLCGCGLSHNAQDGHEVLH